MNYKLHALIAGGLALLGSSVVQGAVIGPIKTAGTVNIAYSYNKSPAGESSNSRSLNVTESFNSYIWQPWFVRWSSSLGFTVSLQNASSKGTTRNINGSLSLDILPRSRFPLLLSYSLSNSATQTEIDANVGVEVTSEHQVRTQIFSAFQTYSSWGGTFYSGWYSSNRYDADAATPGADDLWGENSALGLSISRRFELHSIEMTVSNSQSSSGLSSSTTRQATSLLHSYSPASEFGVNSNFSAVNLDYGVGAGRNQKLSAGSSFYWRPEYSSFSVNGSIKAKEDINNDSSSRNLSVQMSGSYRITRAVRMTAGVSAQLSESANSNRQGGSTQNLGISYSSDQVTLGKFTWSWHTGTSMSNSFSAGGGQERSDSRSVNLSLGHSANRRFTLSENSSLALSLSQSGGMSKSFAASSPDVDNQINKSLAHSMSTNYRISGKNGSTAVWSSLTDNRDLVVGTSQQGFQLSITRDEKTGRTSTLSGSLNYSFSQRESVNSDTESGQGSSSTSSGSMAYINSQFFGIHRLMLSSDLRLSEVGSGEAGTAISSKWNNRLRYKLGLLSASFNASYLHRSNVAGISQLYMFRVTRAF